MGEQEFLPNQSLPGDLGQAWDIHAEPPYPGPMAVWPQQGHGTRKAYPYGCHTTHEHPACLTCLALFPAHVVSWQSSALRADDATDPTEHGSSGSSLPSLRGWCASELQLFLTTVTKPDSSTHFHNIFLNFWIFREFHKEINSCCWIPGLGAWLSLFPSQEITHLPLRNIYLHSTSLSHKSLLTCISHSVFLPLSCPLIQLTLL